MELGFVDPQSVEDDGKLGDPATQDAGVPFDVRVFATDQYWNPVSDSSPVLPMNIDFSSSDIAAVLPSDLKTNPVYLIPRADRRAFLYELAGGALGFAELARGQRVELLAKPHEARRRPVAQEKLFRRRLEAHHDRRPPFALRNVGHPSQ